MGNTYYIGGTHVISEPDIWVPTVPPIYDGWYYDGGVINSGHVIVLAQSQAYVLNLEGTVDDASIDLFESRNLGAIGAFFDPEPSSGYHGGTLAFVGANTNLGTILAYGNYLVVQTPAVKVALTDLASPSGVVIQQAVLKNNGFIDIVEARSVQIGGQATDAVLVNDGTIRTSESVDIKAAVTGTGSFSIFSLAHTASGAGLTFRGVVSGGQTIDFGDGVITLDDPKDFRATIQNYLKGGNGKFLLPGVSTTSASFINHTLTLMNGADFVSQLRFTSEVTAPDVQIQSDSTGTTIFTTESMAYSGRRPGNITISTSGSVPLAPAIVLPTGPKQLPNSGPDVTLTTGAITATIQKVDAYTLRLEGTSAASAPSVNASSAVFGSHFALRVEGSGTAARFGSFAAVGYNENDGGIATEAGLSGGGATLTIGITDVTSPTGTTILTGALNNVGTIEAGGGTTIDITGSAGSKLVNSGTIRALGALILGTNITGTGTIAVGNAAGVAGSLEAQGPISTGQSVQLYAGRLTLDTPTNFHATIFNFDAKDTIVLKGVDVTSATYVNGALLLDGGADGTLHFRRPTGVIFTSDSFALGHTVGGDTTITFHA